MQGKTGQLLGLEPIGQGDGEEDVGCLRLTAEDDDVVILGRVILSN